MPRDAVRLGRQRTALDDETVKLPLALDL